MTTYTKAQVADAAGIRRDQFKKNLQAGMYDHITGPLATNARGHRLFSEEQKTAILDWYHSSRVRLRVLAMGGGVQTTTMLRMVLAGEFDPAPDLTMFVDLGNESQATYLSLAQLAQAAEDRNHPFHWIPGGDIKQDLLDAAADRGKSVDSPPVFIRKDDGTKGQLTRQCTAAYKIEVMAREIRHLLKVPDGALMRHQVEIWLGITTDEAHRLNNNSRYTWITNRFPLVDRGLSRDDCARWLRFRGFPVPPKSACLICPYRPNPDWLDMKQNRPDEWLQVVSVDQAIRTGFNKIIGEVFLHQSLKPLDLVNLDGSSRGGWGNECGGHCAT